MTCHRNWAWFSWRHGQHQIKTRNQPSEIKNLSQKCKNFYKKNTVDF